MAFNQSILPLTVAWNAKRFAESKSARMAARRSIFRASTIMLNTEWKSLESQNNEIRHEINRCRTDLQKYDDKLQVLDNMTHLATQSLEVYFQARMENLRTFVTEQCRIISDGIQEEADHWKEIHAMLQQKLVVPGDLRSYGGGNGLPRAVKQSPNFSRIAEEDEEGEQKEEEHEDEDETTDMEKTKNRTTLRQSRTFTPLITQSLKKARLLASKLSQDTSMILPPQLSVSTAVHEETINEEPPASVMIPEAHVTLPDVSVIEKATEMNHEIPNSELSVSLLPCLPTAVLDEENGSEDEEKPYSNKSIASTISDKTFVKTSLKPFSSDEESDDEDDEDTIIESSLIADNTENARPLLLTADRSIRRPAHPPSLPPVREENHVLVHQPMIKQEKVSFREPLPVDPNVSNGTLLLNKTTFDAEESDFIRPTIDENCNTSKLPTIPSADLNEVENEKDDTVQEKLADVEIPITGAKTCASPVLEPMLAPVPPVENNTKRRTTRRTTTRLLRENQNDNLPTQTPVEMPKTRYATRYSTRLASSVSNEEVTTTRRSTMHRRTTRFTSE
ncbi:unnamed protein product [Adineta ricciae]|uniref:Uncharacterized protein n=1 Tax=Adineta ricciae TaxID=249248 RepID=A0A813ZYE3_ADIRI|nr:unnamed protein product [Adineta ricciae]CAF1193080.1 unnamed protein product [Adineta ricciae]